MSSYFTEISFKSKKKKNSYKKINWKPSSGRSQENECYRRPIYKQFVQISGLCGPQFLSYNVHVFAEMFHIIIETTPYWWTVLVHQ